MQGLLFVACIQLSCVGPSVAHVFDEGLSLVQVKAESRASFSQTQTVCHAGPEQLRHKVFVHSLPKAATSSVGRALNLLGYEDCHEDWLRSASPNQYSKHWDDIEAAAKMVHGKNPAGIPQDIQKKVQSLLANFKQDVDRCQSFSDLSIGHASQNFPLALKNILWPEGRYIWINRPFESWYTSFVKQKDGSKIPKQKLHEEYTRLKDEALAFRKEMPDKLLFVEIEEVGWSPIVKFLFDDACTPPQDNFPMFVNQRLKNNMTVAEGTATQGTNCLPICWNSCLNDPSCATDCPYCEGIQDGYDYVPDWRCDMVGAWDWCPWYYTSDNKMKNCGDALSKMECGQTWFDASGGWCDVFSQCVWVDEKCYYGELQKCYNR